MKQKQPLDMATVLREIDPKRVEHDRQAVMESLHRPTPPMFFEAAKGEDESEAPAAPAEERPVTKAAPVVRALPKKWKLVGGFAAVALAAPLLSLVAWRRATTPERPAATTTASATAGPSVMTLQSAAAVVMGPAPNASISAMPSMSVNALPSAAVSAPPMPTKAHPKSNAEPRDAGAAPAPSAAVETAPTAVTPSVLPLAPPPPALPASAQTLSPKPEY